MKQLLALFAILAMSSTICSRVAAAQDVSQAEALNAEGKDLIRKLDLEGAADRFRRANQLVPDPRYAFNLCYTLEKSRKFADAQLACKQVEASQDARLAAKARELLVSIEQNLAARPVLPQTEPQPIGTAPPAVASVQPIGAQPQVAPGGLYVQQFPGPPQRRTHSYMTHVLLADVASWTVLVLGGAAESPELASIGVAGLVLGGAVVHVGHGNTRSALLSVAMRTGLPLVGALAFSAGCDGFDCLGTAIAGAVLGYGGAVVLDWYVLAEKTEYVYPGGPLVLQPTLDIRPDGALAGIRLQL